MRILLMLLRTATVITIVALVGITLNLVIACDPLSKQHVVEIRNLEFTTKELVVAPGDTITWVNYDIVPHTVTADDESWDSGLVEAQGQWQTVVKADMHKTYFCRYHPSMTAGFRIVRR